MARIIRCPSCFTYVYESARHCHGCGERLRNRKVMGRGAWVFVILAVLGFTVIRSVVLAQERRNRVTHEMQDEVARHVAEPFLRAWITREDQVLASLLTSTPGFVDDVVELRKRYSGRFPAERLDSIRIDSTSSQQHFKWDRQPAAHVAYAKGSTPSDAKIPHAIAVPASMRASLNAHLGRATSWDCRSAQFYAAFRQGGKDYELWGRICVNGSDAVTCLQIDRLDCVTDGEVISPKGA